MNQFPRSFDKSILVKFDNILKESDFEEMPIETNMKILKQAKDLALKLQVKGKSGVDKLQDFCHQYMMDNEEEVLGKPHLSEKYIEDYVKTWRGGKKALINARYVGQMMDFCDKYFNFLANNTRKKLKECLVFIEYDIKMDATDQKKKLVSLLERDPSMLEEDLMREYDKELIKEMKE